MPPKFYAEDKWYYVAYFVVLLVFIIGLGFALFSKAVAYSFAIPLVILGTKIQITRWRKQKERKQNLKELDEAVKGKGI